MLASACHPFKKALIECLLFMQVSQET
ncbi:hypothetical protein BCEP4_1870002 [Burkholderia cepacia]|nr:hypothetical protein BCEP4_1870002 [Burkholderia cepacia]